MKVRLVSIDSVALEMCTIFLMSPKNLNSYKQRNTYLAKKVIFDVLF